MPLPDNLCATGALWLELNDHVGPNATLGYQICTTASAASLAVLSSEVGRVREEGRI